MRLIETVLHICMLFKYLPVININDIAKLNCIIINVHYSNHKKKLTSKISIPNKNFHIIPTSGLL